MSVRVFFLMVTACGDDLQYIACPPPPPLVAMSTPVYNHTYQCWYVGSIGFLFLMKLTLIGHATGHLKEVAQPLERGPLIVKVWLLEVFQKPIDS